MDLTREIIFVNKSHLCFRQVIRDLAVTDHQLLS